MKAVDTNSFIEKARLKHGSKYNYDKVMYIKSNINVIINCDIHGYFEQKPNKHLSSHGCPQCGRNIISEKITDNKDVFVQKAKLKHGDKYDYSLVNYKKSRLKVKIKCNDHGVFEQRPNDHLQGKGCMKCRIENSSIQQGKSPSGWNVTNWCKSAERSKYFDSFKVYIIRCWNENEEFYKVGRTFRDVKKRFYCKDVMPYNYEIIEEIVFDKHTEMIDNAIECYTKELELKRLNKKLKYIPNKYFKGMHECFSSLNYKPTGNQL